MVMYIGQNREDSRLYLEKEIGQEDGQSTVEITQVKAVCNKCGVVYTDHESIEMVTKWSEEGFAPCPNISCPGELEIQK